MSVDDVHSVCLDCLCPVRIRDALIRHWPIIGRPIIGT